MAQQVSLSSFPKPLLEVTNVSTLSIDVLKEEIAQAIRQKHLDVEYVCLAKNVTYDGFNYRTGMILAHGSLAGIPELFHCSEAECVALGTLQCLSNSNVPHQRN